MKTIIEKDITGLREKQSDEIIIKALFDKVVSAEPRRCFLSSRNKIFIRNYSITKSHDSWVRGNPLMLGINMWSLISYAEIKINDKDNSLVYEIDSTLIVLINSLFLFLFSFVPFFGVYKGTNNIVNALQIGGLCFGIFAILTALNLLHKYLTHKNLIMDFIAKMKSKNSEVK